MQFFCGFSIEIKESHHDISLFPHQTAVISSSTSFHLNLFCGLLLHCQKKSNKKYIMIEEHSMYKNCDVHRKGEGEKRSIKKFLKLFSMCSLCSHYTKGIAEDEKREIECGGQKENFLRGVSQKFNDFFNF